MTVQRFMEIVWTAFEKFEIFIEMSEEKKRHDCISSRDFFPTPKKLQLFVHEYRPVISSYHI